MAAQWFGGLDLAYKYALGFGVLLVATLIIGGMKIIYNRQKMKKLMAQNNELISGPNDEQHLTTREKDEGDLFGIRAIEAGYFGGVVQSRTVSPAITPMGSPRSQSPAPSLTGPLSNGYRNGYRPVAEPPRATPATVSFADTPSTYISRDTQQRNRGAALAPVSVRAPTGLRLQPSEAELSGRINHPYSFNSGPNSPAVVSEPSSDIPKMWRVVNEAESTSTTPTTADFLHDATSSSSSPSNGSRSSAVSTDSSFSSHSIVTALPAFPARAMMSSTEVVNDPEQAAKNAQKLAAARRARKAIARRSSSAVPFGHGNVMTHRPMPTEEAESDDSISEDESLEVPVTKTISIPDDTVSHSDSSFSYARTNPEYFRRPLYAPQASRVIRQLGEGIPLSTLQSRLLGSPYGSPTQTTAAYGSASYNPYRGVNSNNFVHAGTFI